LTPLKKSKTPVGVILGVLPHSASLFYGRFPL
jgi:hypothetical protein